MQGEKNLKQIADKVLKFSTAEETEVLLFVGNNSLTRFANNQIHQNVAWHDLGISIRIVNDKKIGVASTNAFDDESLKKLVDKAIELAKLQKPDKYFISLPDKNKIPKVKNIIYDAKEDELARGVYTVIKKAKITEQEFENLLEKIGIVSVSTKNLLQELSKYGFGKITGAGGKKTGSGYLLFLADDVDGLKKYCKYKKINIIKFKQSWKGVQKT